MISIDNYDFKGKRAIIRVDFNVPLNEKGEVTDDTRIRAAIPTIKKVLAEGGSVILMSHMGRPKKNPDPKYSLEQIVPAVEKNLGTKVEFAGDCIGEKAAEMAKNLKPGQVMLLENLRFYAEEEGKPRGLAEDASKEEKDAAKKALKEGPQKEFVKKLASLADCYINDAFGTAHRKHASTYLIAKQFPNDKMFGYLMEKEVKAISSLMEAPAHPFCAIVGGSKVSSKIGVIKALIEKVDSIIIGGGMTYTFIKAMGGNELSAYGLAHLGDYEATLFSEYSHNRMYGEMLVKDKKFEKLAEGVPTAAAMKKLGEKYGVDLPITCAVYDLCYGESEEDCRGRCLKLLAKLFARDTKSEFYS